jgi:hypothetical protein
MRYHVSGVAGNNKDNTQYSISGTVTADSEYAAAKQALRGYRELMNIWDRELHWVYNPQFTIVPDLTKESE